LASPKDEPLTPTSLGQSGPGEASVPVHAVLGLAAEYAELCGTIEDALRRSEGAESNMRDTASKLCGNPDMPVLSSLPDVVSGTLWRLALAQVMLQNCQQDIQELAASRSESCSSLPDLRSNVGRSASELSDTSTSCGGDATPQGNPEEPSLETPPSSKAKDGLNDLGECSMRKHLRDLQDEDQECVLLIREIQRLGFSPQAALMGHFSMFGPVKQILVARSATTGARKRSRIRPAGLGFVVMENAEAAAAVLAKGERQVIEGTVVEVRIRRFKHANPEAPGSPGLSTWADISGF